MGRDIKIVCKRCQGRSIIDESGIGLTIECPHCGVNLVVAETLEPSKATERQTKGSQSGSKQTNRRCVKCGRSRWLKEYEYHGYSAYRQTAEDHSGNIHTTMGRYENLHDLTDWVCRACVARRATSFVFAAVVVLAVLWFSWPILLQFLKDVEKPQENSGGLGVIFLAVVGGVLLGACYLVVIAAESGARIAVSCAGDKLENLGCRFSGVGHKRQSPIEAARTQYYELLLRKKAGEAISDDKLEMAKQMLAAVDPKFAKALSRMQKR